MCVAAGRKRARPILIFVRSSYSLFKKCMRKYLHQAVHHVSLSSKKDMCVVYLSYIHMNVCVCYICGYILYVLMYLYKSNYKKKLKIFKFVRRAEKPLRFPLAVPVYTQSLRHFTCMALRFRDFDIS